MTITCCANRMTGRSIDAWSNRRTQEKQKSTRLQIRRVEPDAFWLPVSGERRRLHPPAFAVQVA